jgi:7-cyano-7-deazaguanine synthase
MKIVALSSGGVDSSVMMLLLQKDNFEVLPLHVNYGHRAEPREWAACKRVCDYIGLKPSRIDLSGFNAIPSGLTNRNLDIVRDAFLPTRNLLFAIAGAAFGFYKSIDIVAMGLLSNPIFPDQTPRFVETTQLCIATALGREFRLLTPLLSLDKRDTISLSKKYDLPLELTYHCHMGGKEDCGKCISCKERLAAEASMREGAEELLVPESST